MDAKIVLFGHPNVGKSVLFNQLTGLTAVVSNYPGTTVEVYEGEARIEGLRLRILDAPGAYSLLATNEAEDVARRLLLEGKPDVVVQVADATSLRRHLYLTLELMELGLPLILVLNQVDRAEKAGIEIDKRELERVLGIPVVLTAAVEGRG
ncbi:MAG TPA: GTP-binding protein, partial [Candidatus Bathyarchaeota archaeon]|nr:GTP-binding protein [Candidatus Bathyarchaeota archaeon]HEW89895.1 GTP-binding protein [Candidatus Bathyarchaeota archaeon]